MSPHLNLLIQRGEVCRSLRTKTMFHQVDDMGPHDGLSAADSAPQGPFWCVRTQSVRGPDGRVAEVDHCRPGRSCCEIA